MKSTLGKKITLTTVSTIMFFGTLATVAVYFSVQKVVLDLEKRNLKVFAKDAASEINRTFINTSIITTTLAKQPEVIDYFTTPTKQDQSLLKILNRYNIKDRFASIYLLSRSGETLISTDPSFTGNNYKFRTYFKKALAGNTYIDMAIGTTTKEPGYYLASPVRNNKGNILGVAVIKMKAEALNQLIHPSGLTNFGHVMLVDNFGIVIHSDDPSKLYKSLGHLNEFAIKEIEKTKKYPQTNFQTLNYNPIIESINKKIDSAVIDLFDPFDNNHEILTYSQIGKLPLYLIYEEEAEDFASSAIIISTILSLFVFMAAIMATLVIILLTRRLLKPLSVITQTLERIGHGKLDQKIEIKTNDEFGELGEIFNKMIDRIKKDRDTVENKISRRTKDLEKFNKLMIGREVKMIELKKEIKNLDLSIKKVNTKTWTQKFKEAVNIEEKLIIELESVYLHRINTSKINKTKKDKIKKLLKKLVTDSKRHEEMFKKIAKAHE